MRLGRADQVLGLRAWPDLIGTLCVESVAHSGWYACAVWYGAAEGPALCAYPSCRVLCCGFPGWHQVVVPA